ncbi:HalOD1 output domain-containing protein [Natronococcus occultus]|uniref:Halobacterial output domain-containing protein n=1 Tax=Natronococcus occultus SP4 TaxID=694430 RepID=L0K386_9EURY|nr:HalOD1 output domain-containing protein [Natronococcus occultus]AGB38789.1 hypothetical protein Natoc_3044 [Natronococcus occultus SP4]
MTDNTKRTEYRTDYSPDRPLVVAVADAIAAVRGTDPAELPPLAAAVPTDALETLIRSGTDATITFAYDELEITVDDRRIVIRGSEAVR